VVAIFFFAIIGFKLLRSAPSGCAGDCLPRVLDDAPTR